MSIDDVQDLAPREQYTALAAQTVFDYGFPIFEEGDLVVDVDGVTQALDTDYTVENEGEDEGGTITFLAAMAGGEIVTVYRDIPIARTSDYQQNGPWRSASTNAEFNRIVMMMQQLEAAIARSLRWPQIANVQSGALELTPLASWLNKFVYIGADGSPEPASAVTGTTLSQSVIGQYLYPQNAPEAAALVTPTILSDAYGVFTRYNGGMAQSAGTNTAALQAALNSNQTVEIHDEGTHNFNGAITYNDNNRIIGKGKGTLLKWNTAGINLIRGLNATGTRRYRFGMRDLRISNTSRANAGTVALDLENLTLGHFENVEVEHVETCLRIDATGAGGAFYNKFFGCGFLSAVDGIIISTLGNQNSFHGCRVGDVVDGITIDDNSGNVFIECPIETFTGFAVDIGATATSQYNLFVMPRIEGGPNGFRLHNTRAATTTIVAPQFTNVSVANFVASAVGQDTTVISGEINSPTLHANAFILGQGGLNGSAYARFKGTSAGNAALRDSTDAADGSLTLANLIATGLIIAKSSTVAGLPAATSAGAMIFVTNETGGAVLAFADGTNWRRVTDRAVVS